MKTVQIDLFPKFSEEFQNTSIQRKGELKKVSKSSKNFLKLSNQQTKPLTVNKKFNLSKNYKNHQRKYNKNLNKNPSKYKKISRLNKISNQNKRSKYRRRKLK